MALVPVAEALEHMLAGVEAGATETVAIGDAAGRVLAAPLCALRTQPPFSASAMDGYAVRAADVATVPSRLRITGTAAAGRLFSGSVGAGEAVRIFTGAPVPAGADTIAIQENVRTSGDDTVEVLESVARGRHIRPVGMDFSEDAPLLAQGRLLDPAALSLAASANHAAVPVVRRPLVALIATGDELLPPGSTTGPDQIIASNSFGVGAIARQAGADVLDLGIVPDRLDLIEATVARAIAAGADVVVTLGGASVGDHDLVHRVLVGLGMELGFWKIAMRPGKPLMYGLLGSTRCLGLPGNPVASLVCSHLFLKPLLLRLGGRPVLDDTVAATLAVDMPANDLRQDYVRASMERSATAIAVTPFAAQDSAMLKVLADADCLLIRAPFAPPARAGDPCRIIPLR
ncbi:molybdopterin molybdotransferase MoeA [Mesorhizobium sp. 10J20-29]